MHPGAIPRGGPQQGRERVSGPLREQVLRGQRQGVGEDAGGGGAEARWCGWGRDVWIMSIRNGSEEVEWVGEERRGEENDRAERLDGLRV